MSLKHARASAMRCSVSMRFLWRFRNDALRLDLRIALLDGYQVLGAGGEIRAFDARGRGGQLGAHLGQLRLKVFLVIAQTLHGVDEVRDKVVPALELGINLGPALAHALTEVPEAVEHQPKPTQATGGEKAGSRDQVERPA